MEQKPGQCRWPRAGTHPASSRVIPAEVWETGPDCLKERLEDQGFRQWPILPYPNAGFPLPGHVLTMRDYGPGLEIWREKGMDGNDW